jgi:hypothetical protein
VHDTLHCVIEPVRVFVVHGLPSSHIAGQLPSHVSPISITPLPQTGVQLPSSFALQPLGQHESPLAQTVIAGYVHCTLHIAALPVRTLLVHELPSSQLAGQLPSHVSPISTTLLPHEGMQLLSLFALQPLGQHESPPAHIVIAGCVHATLHCVGLPVSTSFVHELPSLAHVVRQLPSQLSPDSTTPLPQTGVQLPSLLALQPDGQQESAPMHIVIGVKVQVTLH